jgi:hypothetical protein
MEYILYMYYNKYLKYKFKYNKLKKQNGGNGGNEENGGNGENGENEENVCPICLNNIIENDKITSTCEGKGKHIYHKECLQRLCDTKNNNALCPICRSNIRNDCLCINPLYTLEEFVNIIKNMNETTNIVNLIVKAPIILDNIYQIFEDDIPIENKKCNFINDNENKQKCIYIINKLYIYQLYNKYLLKFGQSLENTPIENLEKWNIEKIIISAIKKNQIEDYEKIDILLNNENFVLNGDSFKPPEISYFEKVGNNYEAKSYGYESDDNMESVVILSPYYTEKEIEDLINKNLNKNDNAELKLKISKSYKILNIPDFVVGIKSFEDCYIEKVIFTKNSKLKIIKKKCFSGCSRLKNINLENCCKLNTIGSNAFEYCNLININIPQKDITLKPKSFLKDIDSNICLNNVTLSNTFNYDNENYSKSCNKMKELKKIFCDIKNGIDYFNTIKFKFVE